MSNKLLPYHIRVLSVSYVIVFSSIYIFLYKKFYVAFETKLLYLNIVCLSIETMCSYFVPLDYKIMKLGRMFLYLTMRQ